MLSEPRLVIERLCEERGEDFAGLSRMLGRNPAYIQQFVRRGVPKRLKEAERRKLARYFAISESLLGGAGQADRRSRFGRPGSFGWGRGGQALFRVRRALAEGADGDSGRKAVDHPRRRRFHVADAQRRRRHLG